MLYTKIISKKWSAFAEFYWKEEYVGEYNKHKIKRTRVSKLSEKDFGITIQDEVLEAVGEELWVLKWKATKKNVQELIDNLLVIAKEVISK